MAVKTDLTVQERELVFEEMSEVTQQAATEGMKKLKAGVQVSVLIPYDLGTIINTVLEAEHLNDSQKKDELRKLAVYWNQPNMTLTTLYDLRNVAISFDRDFINAQVQEPMVNGNYITWSHFKELQKIGNETKQLTILNKVRQQSWSSNELAFEMQGKKQNQVKRSGGRKPTLPKTATGMLQKLYTTVQQADNFIDAVTEPLTTTFMEIPPDAVDEVFVGSLEDTQTKLDALAERIKDTKKHLSKVQKRSLKVINELSQDDSPTLAIAAKAAISDEDTTATKKRGRPRKSESAGNASDAASVIMSESGIKRRRGRPRRSSQ
jgi:hypothetical protein